jgi:hypothetical protein
MGNLYENQYTFFIICPSILLKMRNVSERICKENHKTHFIINFFFFFLFFEIMWKNTAEPGRSQMTTWRLRIECWTLKATNTN